MLRIAALNEEFSEESSESDEPLVPTKEIDAADSLILYKEALELRQKNEFEAALKLFNETLALPCIENAVLDDKDNKGHNTAQLSSCLQIKYACLKNIGALHGSRGNLDEALDAYLEAVEVDPLDVTVWYNIGKLAMTLKNFQLARHAFLQGLQCSSNHWPCLDGLISLLFGIGDDVVCLHYINIALGRDPFYSRGLILRDSIFQVSPSLKEDIKAISSGVWTHLTETYSYTDEEKKEYLEEAQKLREELGGQYNEVILPKIPLEKKIESITWVAVGESLLATYKKMLEDNSKMSCPIELEAAEKKNEEIQPMVVDPSSSSDPNIEAPEAMECSDIQMTEIEVPSDKDVQPVGEISENKQRSRKNSGNEEITKLDAEVPSDLTVKAEPPTKSDSRKRKRSLEHGTPVSDKEIQRRSTRSRAYAQQVEEDIYSLRAELRSFLPTSLLLDDNKEKDIETEQTVQTSSSKNDEPNNIPTTEEQKGVSAFLEKAKSSNLLIIDLLRMFCVEVAKLDNFRWTGELCHLFKEAYQTVRSRFHVSDLFQSTDGTQEPKGLETLIHAELLVSCQKIDLSTAIPSWFIDDLTFLFQCADPIDSSSLQSSTFQARVFWLHSNWNYQNDRVEVASNYLQMGKNCFNASVNEIIMEMSGITSITTHSIDKSIVLKVGDVFEMEKVVLQTMQLEDVVKLHQKKQFKQLVTILKATFVTSDSTNAKASHHKYRVPVDRPTQIGMLLDGLSALEDFNEYLSWSEQSLDESISQYLAAYNRKSTEEGAVADQPSTSQLISDWSKVIERISNDIEEILRFKRTTLNELSRRALIRLAENLVLVCSHQLEAPETNSKMPLSSPIFWVLLHRVIEFEELRLAWAKKNQLAAEKALKSEQEESEEEEADEALPCSILFLLSAHDLLGKHSWCMLQEGVFVLYLLEVLMRKRRVTHDLEDREELGRAIEQASFCALGYPTSKKSKSRSLTDHSVSSVPLTWSRVLLLAEFFLPTRQDLPEFDTVKPTSNAEQEMLLQKVSSLIPPELDPRNRLEDIQSFIQGRRPDIPEYLSHSCVPREIENVYYLLGDYYFKNKEWVKAIESYILDLALVPDRFDSWAAVALAIGSRLETKLNSCERLKNLGTFLDRAEAALRCFRRALCLRPLQTTLWIEQGSTAYMLHSFCSQLLRNETDSLSIEMFERLEKEKERMLDIAHDCFVAADKASLTGLEKGTCEDQDERWLHHYMLGKVAEKRSKPFGELIEHYQRAAQLLEESSAAYPRKITYNTPPQLSVEALEIHYRIHSNCLKVLMSLEDKAKDVVLFCCVSKQLQIASNGAFARGGRRVSIEQKEDVQEKDAKKRKASKHEEDKPSKKGNFEKAPEIPELVTTPKVPEVRLEGRAATIHDVTLILNEILEQVIRTAKPSSGISWDETFIKPTEEKDTYPILASRNVDEYAQLDTPTIPQPPGDALVLSSTSTSSSSDSSSSNSDDESTSDSDSDATKNEESDDKNKNEVKIPETEPVPEEVNVPDLQEMIDICLGAIKECVGRFPHFYKGLYRLAHYYYHSKVNHNIEACRELLLGRPISASIAQLQQQQGVVQLRFLPTGVAGLFTEWRSNNFFHGIWRIPINEIDRPGCFASHMGRSAALLLDVLRETRDHRLLMELALALQPEPEPDKKYLFDSEREQHASLALSLMVQVLRSRLQEIKDATITVLSGGDDLHSSPQQGSPSSSKKLSLLMDTFRAYDRIERNLPGQEAVFGALLFDTYKVYRGSKDHNENDAALMEQALSFCRNKQAQSRARVGGVRGGMASSLGVVSTRGKRPYATNRRGKNTGLSRSTAVRDHSNIGSLPPQPSASLPSGQNSASVMQEAMKLLQSAGGSINNLPQHLKNIPGISNLLALFSTPAGDKATNEIPTPAPALVPAPYSSPVKSATKKDIAVPKPVAPTVVPPTPTQIPAATPVPAHTPAPLPAHLPVPSTSQSQASALPNQLLQSLAAAGGSSTTPSSLAGLGMMDPALLAMLSNPYLNPMSMFGGPIPGADASSMSKMQNDYQQQMMNWMQSALAQSYMLSSLNPSFYPNQPRSRGRGVRKSSSMIRPSGRTNSAPKDSYKPTMNVIGETSNVPSSNRTSTPDSGPRSKPLDFLKRPESMESSKSSSKNSDVRTSTAGPSAPRLPSDFKLPPPLFDSSMMRLPTHQESGVKHKSVSSANVPSKKKSHPSSSSSHASSSSSKSHKRAMTTPTIDVGKLIAGFSPAFDLGRMGASKMDSKFIDPSLRGKHPKASGDSQSFSSKSSSNKALGNKEVPTNQFPISLGRDITVTATSTSSKPIVSQQTAFPSSSASSSRTKQSHYSSSALNCSGFPGIPPATQLFSHPGLSSRQQTDPHNIAFSVLQNLPSSMSLLVKPSSSSSQSHGKHASSSKSQTGPIDLVVNKPTQHTPVNPMALPKLTPAPKLHSSKKGKQGMPSHVSLPPLKSNSPIPPFLPHHSIPSSLSAAQQAAPRNLPNQKSLNRVKGIEKKDSGDDSDVVVLD